jgi:hypothetical protein
MIAPLTSTNTQIEKFNKFIGYLDELETKQKFKSVSYPRIQLLKDWIYR